jgi:predicted transcriptional regulator
MSRRVARPKRTCADWVRSCFLSAGPEPSLTVNKVCELLGNKWSRATVKEVMRVLATNGVIVCVDVGGANKREKKYKHKKWVEEDDEQG